MKVLLISIFLSFNISFAEEKKFSKKEVDQIVDRALERAQEKNNSKSPNEVRTRELSDEDRKILSEGEMSDGRYISSGIVGSYFGFGIGHAIQGRYGDMGWKFTVGELVSLSLLVSGAMECVTNNIGDDDDEYDCNNSAATVGIIGFIGFRIWEIVDIWRAPYIHDQRYRELKRQQRPSVSFMPLIRPSIEGNSFGLGFAYKF